MAKSPPLLTLAKIPRFFLANVRRVGGRKGVSSSALRKSGHQVSNPTTRVKSAVRGGLISVNFGGFAHKRRPLRRIPGQMDPGGGPGCRGDRP